ncbi:3-oxoacyl-(acyl-carrier-protein) reductase [gamma proteobacterium HTCC2207]|jgi:3-oxoacyl-[acyl-carrier protein] reductase|uniref:3-oxoacyl-[acyl-carrier-protein] reductase n=1 Tax=gamma proteobacterium HTCC2207 TaxID=314287 RepID=Q1YTQ0_9GAMM|nr:3-oxoacyl-(acyl-carrier-protein) reductase [gamma proteobacterium HTCC2207]MDB4427706.1 3-oxoacyl-ACP reductase FabG [Porticoccaceae bacterium]MDC0517414.1 3-oxoacyl-ACP reductase FabG [Porticoccaceae bacterium]MDG1079873.1 3-oxoacyl-ACP reductase FabG [Porticoccaceae bacterium]MDG1081117.1 3-oxoacyl-ACP reductase FabG [Porticoccaceae bacterium]
MNLNDKVALVTGATRGIGAAIAEALGKAGATVVGTATSEAGAASISQRFADNGVNGIGMVLNVTDAESVANVIKAITEQFAAPTILVNNAGITKDNILMRMKDDEWMDVLDTNLTSVFRLAKGCVRPMTKARWGRIINISSVVGAMGNAGQSNYSASKAGVGGFTRALAKELGSRNITVNTVAPGFIDTDMTKDLAETSKEAMLTQIPLARLGAPEEIAAVVCFLAGDAAGYITGETIHVNGGMYMS